ncbi:MAG: DUF1127 domain-containing protein [Devosiaceae bacterium]|nr:DUF1127 domain-containing protein [Devosiaceae bacterium MH13]
MTQTHWTQTYSASGTSRRGRGVTALMTVGNTMVAYTWRAFQALGTLARHVRSRQGVASMLELDDAILRDIGVSRADVHWAAHLPLRYSAGEELARVSGRRCGRKPR